jgi:hypothetical protein
MIKMLRDWTYSSNGVNCVTLKEGDSVEGVKPEILEDWLSRGICGEEKSQPKKETKIVNPVEEVKEDKPKRKTRSRKAQ